MTKRIYNQLENLIPAQVKLSFLPASGFDRFELSEKNNDWVKELLIELNEKNSEESDDEKLSHTNLNIKMEIGKRHKGQFGEFALVKVQVDGTFTTECVKTLTPIEQILFVKFQACFLNESFEKSSEYEELTELFIENDVFELYFLNRGQADLKETLHEQIYLNVDPYPTKEDFSEEVKQ